MAKLMIEAQVDERCCAPMTQEALSTSDADDFAQLFAALGDPVRLRLFSIIAASAVSATVALPAAASVNVIGKQSSTSAYTQKDLQQSANFYAALDHKTQY